MNFDKFDPLSSININNRMKHVSGLKSGPKLTETGVHYFLRETLKKYNTDKFNVTSLNINLLLFGILIITISSILYYKYKHKPSLKKKKEIDNLKKSYILGKIKSLNVQKQKEYDQTITNLPKFESDYEIMHKKFYDV